MTESGHILYDLRDKKLVRRQNSDELLKQKLDSATKDPPERTIGTQISSAISSEVKSDIERGLKVILLKLPD